MLYGLQAKVLLGAVALLVLLGGLTGLYFYGYNKGAASVQADWDKERHNIADLAEKELEEDRDIGYQLAVEWQHELSQLKVKYDDLNTKYRNSLKSPVVCPASGQIGDVVLPADLVDSLFTSDKRPVSTAGSASAGTNGAVR
jgi:hypothetical protein